MNRYRRKLRPAGNLRPAQNLRRFVGAVARRRYLAVTAVVAAVAMGVALAPRAPSDAATTATAAPSDDGFTWTPTSNPPYQGGDASGCQLYSLGTIAVKDHNQATGIYNILSEETAVPVNQDGIKLLALDPDDSPTGTSFGEYADAAVDCSLENQGTAYVKRLGYGSLGQYTQAVLDASLHPAPAGSRLRSEQRATLLTYDAVPPWLRAAIGAVVGAVVFVAVSAVVVTTAAAVLGEAVLVSAAVVRVVAGVAGCLGGAAGVAAGLSIANTTLSPLAKVTGSAALCVVGGALAQVPGSQQLGASIGFELRNYFSTVPALVGTGAEATGAAAGVELTPAATAVQDVAAAL